MPSTGKIRATGIDAGTNVTIGELQVVCFKLDGNECGIEVSSVEEIIRPQEVYGGAESSPFIIWKISWRGQDIPLVDLRIRLDCRAGEDKSDERVIIVNCKGQYLAGLVDSVTEVLRIHEERIIRNTSKDAVTRIRGVVKGVFQEEDNSVYILDCNKVFGL